jgi:OOP family OmpA-OmpF porin
MSKKKLLTTIVVLIAALQGFAQDNMLFREPIPLPDIINSSAEEIQPIFDKDSSHLYFVRSFHPENTDKGETGDQDIWVAEHDAEGNWISVHAMDYFNNEENNGVFGISNDSKTIYLLNAYLKRKKALHKGVSTAIKKGDEWEHRPHTLKIEDFELHGEHYSFHISPKEDVMVIAEEGENSLGEEDLYVSKLGDDGVWNKPIHLGPKVNSTGYEMSPFLSPNEDTLYFSSNGHEGLGDADIFYCIRLDDTWQNWSDPINLGGTINTEFFDAYFIRSHDDVYFCSNRTGNNQIYHTHAYTPHPPIIFNVLTSTNPTGKTVEDGSITLGGLEPEFTYDELVFYQENGDSIVIPNVESNSGGEVYIPNLGEGTYDDFVLRFDRYEGTTEDVATLTAPDDPPLLVEVVAQRFEGIVLFDRNSSFLNRDATLALKALLPKIQATSNYKIEIIAHTSKRASEKYNLWLSEKRLKAVTVWLTSKGINGGIITGSFKGETQPINDCEECKTEELHGENRRATIIVTF